MAKVFLEESILSGIASAIREKNGESTSYYPGEFVEKIKILPNTTDVREIIDGTIEELNTDVSKVRRYCFAYALGLEKINCPNCRIIEDNAFYACWDVNFISFPKCSTIYYNAFEDCRKLFSASFPECTEISSLAFEGCRKLLSFYLPSTSICSLKNINAFSSTPIAGYTASTSGVYGSIYVPASLVSAYKVAENWSYYSNRITAIPES